MRRVTRLLDQAVREAGVGHLELAFPDEPSAWRRATEGGLHHMGTTRMHVDPQHGVVDENSRVHGTSNLFVAGSSRLSKWRVRESHIDDCRLGPPAGRSPQAGGLALTRCHPERMRRIAR